MKTTNLLTLAAVVLLSSCTTAYRTGQTPDDVYYSPMRPEEEYVKVQRQESRRYRYAEESYDDRYLRMRVHNRRQWNDLNDWYAYERWTLGYNSYFAPSLNPYVSWNYYYNPYFNHYTYNSPYLSNWAIGNSVVKPRNSGPRTFNMNTYQQMPVNLKSVKAQSGQYTPGNYTQGASNQTNSSNRGNSLREIFGNNGNNYSSPNNNTGSSSPSNTQSSSSSSSSSSSAPVRRF